MYIGRSGVQASPPLTWPRSALLPGWTECALIFGSRSSCGLRDDTAPDARTDRSLKATLLPAPPLGLAPPDPSALRPAHVLDVHSCVISQPGLQQHHRGWTAALWGFGSICEAFFRSLLVLIFVALLRTLYQPIPGKQSPFGRFLSRPLRPVPVRCLNALAVASPAVPVLSWHNFAKQRPYNKHRPFLRGLCIGPIQRVVLGIWGLTSMPICVWAVPQDSRPFLQAAWHISHCPPNPPVDISPDPVEPATFSFREGITEPLPPTYDLQDRYRDQWLGIAVYAPYFPTTAFAMRVNPGASVERVCQLAKESNRCPCEHHDSLAVVHPQVHSGSLSLLSYPSIISHGKRPRCAVVIDLTRVGGSCYAATLPSDAGLDDLWREVGTAMNVDVESEPVQVWIADASLPVSHTGTLNVAHGTLVTVCRPTADRPIAPVPFYASDLLLSEDKWDRVEHMPRPRSAHCLAVGCGSALDPIVLAFFPRFFKQEVALRVSKLTAEQAEVVIVDNTPPLDLKGEPCPQTALVLPRSEGEIVYFLDTRPIGVIPRLVTSQKSLPDLPQILAAADIEFPFGTRGDLLSTTHIGGVQVLQIGVEVELAHKIFANEGPLGAAGLPPCTAFAAPPRNHVTGEHEASGMPVRDARAPMPPRFGRPFVRADAHEALDLVRDEESPEGHGDLIAIVEAIFLVFAPRYRHEVYHLMIPADCTANEALYQIADARDSATSICFACLIPASPQPASSFACLLAIPVWVSSGICLIDARAVNQGIFAHQFFGRVKRASILLQIGHPLTSDLRVRHDGHTLADEVLYEFSNGSLLEILPVGADPTVRHTFGQLLANGHRWDPSDPFLYTEEGTDFLLIHEHGRRAVSINLDTDDTSLKFKRKAAEEFLFDVAKVTACPSVPRVRDCTHLGRVCLAIVAVTEGISRIPIPPGRPLLMQHIVFIDQRPLLKEVVWTLATLGILDEDRLLRDLQGDVPFGHSLSLTGGRRETRGDRNYIRVAHGEVLVLKYVEDLPSPGPADSEDGGGSPGDSDNESNDSDESSSHGDSILRSPESPARQDRGGTDRSRSPRKGPPPPTAIPPSEILTASAAISFRRRGTCCLTGGDLFGCGAISVIANFNSVKLLAARVADVVCEAPQTACRLSFPGGAQQCKLLSEPVSDTPAGNQHLQDLRTVTRAFGGNWLAQRNAFLPEGFVQEDVDSPAQARNDEQLRLIGCAVLKVGYVPELLTIRIALPATPEEAESIVKAARCPRLQQKFPWILPILPQPGLGAACYVASPSWLPELQPVCLDTMDIDGRLFAARVPDYISRHELLQFAGLGSSPGLGVWIGPDQALLANEEPVHTFPGMLISIRPIHREPVAPYTLGQLLLFLDGWDEAPAWPESRFGPANILVHRDRAALISASYSEPWRYRAMIGEAVDVDPLHMQLFAAAPRPLDTAMNGVHCRAVIAVGSIPPVPVQRYWHCVLVDCRHIQEGWLELALFEGVLDVNELSTVLNDSAPHGWHVHIDVAPQRAGCVYLQPGHVIHASYEDHPQTFLTGGDLPPSQETSGDLNGANARIDDPTQGLLDAGEQPEQDVAIEEPAVDTIAAEPDAHITCYLFAPDYCPVEIDIPTHLPTTVEPFLATVRECRPVDALPYFPRLCVVHPQPDPTYVCLLAIPDWPTVGVPVLIQSLGDAPRTFAIFLPPVITHDDVLLIAGVSPGLGFRAYHRDLPWPVPERGEFRVEAGDLLTAARPDSYRPGWVLADTLLWTYGWYQPAEPPGHWPGGTWLITDTEDRHVFAALPSGRTSLQVVAESLSLDPDSLFVYPAYPPILDHANRGRLSESVVIAVVPEDHPRPEDVLYVLDQRPVLLPIRVMRAPGGRIDIAF